MAPAAGAVVSIPRITAAPGSSARRAQRTEDLRYSLVVESTRDNTVVMVDPRIVASSDPFLSSSPAVPWLQAGAGAEAGRTRAGRKGRDGCGLEAERLRGRLPVRCRRRGLRAGYGEPGAGEDSQNEAAAHNWVKRKRRRHLEAPCCDVALSSCNPVGLRKLPRRPTLPAL